MGKLESAETASNKQAWYLALLLLQSYENKLTDSNNASTERCIMYIHKPGTQYDDNIVQACELFFTAALEQMYPHYVASALPRLLLLYQHVHKHSGYPPSTDAISGSASIYLPLLQ